MKALSWLDAKSMARVLRKILSTTLVTVALGSCMSEEEQQQLDNVLTEPNFNPGIIQPPLLPTGCTYERFTQPEAEISSLLDILFVIDTSGSFAEERGQVADAIDSFVQALPTGTNYRIAVMLAHGSRSAYAGKLYSSRVAIQNNEPMILNSQAMALAEIRFHLRNKVTSIRTDHHSDGGEEGLYSLMRGTEAQQLAEHQNAGFFRSDAALATIFIADENDICAEYPAGIIPVPDPQGVEAQAKLRDCAGITPEAVVTRLRTIKDEMPLFVGGVIYNNLNSVPSGGENEYGYGYDKTILVGNGMSIDLANGDYQVGMTQLGQLVSVKMNLLTEFSLTATDVDPASVQTFIDGNAVPFYFASNTRTVHLTAAMGEPNSIVDVVYCPTVMPNDKVSDLCEAGSFVSKPNPLVGVSLDPAEGSQQQISNGLISMGFNPVIYSDAQIAAGVPITAGVDILVIARKVALSAVSQAYIDGVLNYLENSGGSLLTEYDGTALLFSDYNGSNPILLNMTPSLELFSGMVRGGGALLPTTSSTTYITDPSHPITQGVTPTFNLGLRAAFAITEYDAAWLDTPADFISLGTLGLVPAGTYPAILAGRCGAGRVAGFSKNYFNVMSQEPVKTMVQNALHWVAGI